jgi:hypothetical protein
MTLTDAFVAHYRPIFTRIAGKATKDAALIEDAVQEAFVALLTEVPDGKINAARNPDAFVRQVAHFAILSYLQSPRKGNWYTGRRMARKGGVFHQKARYVGIDGLLRGQLVQITAKGELVPGSRANNPQGDFEYTERVADISYFVRIAI